MFRDELFVMFIGGLMLCVATGGGWLLGREQMQDKWDADRLRQARVAAEAQAAAVRAVQDRLAAETARGEALSRRLLDAQTELDQQQQELNREIARSTTGRTCLDARTVGLLNAAGHRDAARPGPMPQTASAPDAAPGAAATDTDVAHWASEARSRYDACRAQLDALIDFEEMRP